MLCANSVKSSGAIYVEGHCGPLVDSRPFKAPHLGPPAFCLSRRVALELMCQFDGAYLERDVELMFDENSVIRKNCYMHDINKAAIHQAHLT